MKGEKHIAPLDFAEFLRKTRRFREQQGLLWPIS